MRHIFLIKLSLLMYLLMPIFCSCTSQSNSRINEFDNIDEAKKSNIYRFGSSPSYINQTTFNGQNSEDDFQPSYHRANIFAPKELRRTGPDFKIIEVE